GGLALMRVRSQARAARSDRSVGTSRRPASLPWSRAGACRISISLVIVPVLASVIPVSVGPAAGLVNVVGSGRGGADGRAIEARPSATPPAMADPVALASPGASCHAVFMREAGPA